MDKSNLLQFPTPNKPKPEAVLEEYARYLDSLDLPEFFEAVELEREAARD